MELKELHEELKSTFADFREAMEERDSEIKELGEARAETEEKIDRINDTISDIEAKMQRLETHPGSTGEGLSAEEKEAQEYKDAFMQYARKGKDELSPEEKKTLTVTDDTTGGFLAPSEFVQDIIKDIVEVSPMRSVARVRTTGNRSVQHPVRDGTFAAQWVTETGTRSETTGLSYGLEEIPTHELYALVDISHQDLEDSAFDLEGELRSEFTEQFAVAESTAFVTGDAVGKPEGLTTNSDISSVNSGASSSVTADGLIDLVYELKSGYTRNARFAMNRATTKEVRKLKDNDNQYLWQSGLANGEPATLLDYPIVEMTDMPDIASNALPIAFGDFQRTYVVVDRVSIAVQRDPFTQATSGAVRFLARKRVGGQVVQADAMKLQKIAA